MQTMTHSIKMWGRGVVDIQVVYSELFIAAPTTRARISEFVGEDLRSAKVLRHLSYPSESIAYRLSDGRIAQEFIKQGGSWRTIAIFANENEWTAFIAHQDQEYGRDPETGRLWSTGRC